MYNSYLEDLDMPFVYPGNPLTLIGKPTVGDGTFKGECAAIAQFLIPGLRNAHVCNWRRGEHVKNQVGLMPGTVIAIFDSNGRYIGSSKHNHSHGVAHVGLYVRQSAAGIEIVHQFKACTQIKGTLVGFSGQSVPGHKSGVSITGDTAEDDANNYYVVEL
jgi:hypothetical protein